MSKLWIVHRSPQVRAALLRATGLTAAEIASGAPTSADFSSAAVPAAIVLALSTDCEPELEFALRVGPRVRGARWILLCPREREAKRSVGSSARTTPRCSITRRIRAPCAPRSRPPSRAGRPRAWRERRIDARTAERFAAWFGATFVPGLEHALDPALAALPLLVRGRPGSGRSLLGLHAESTRGGAAPVLRIDARDLADLDALATRLATARDHAGTPVRTLWLDEVDALSFTAQRALAEWIRHESPPGRDASGSSSRHRFAGSRPRAPPVSRIAWKPVLSQAFAPLVVQRSPARSAKRRARAHGRVRRARVGPAGRRPAARLRPERPRGPRRGALVGRPRRARGRPALDARELATRSDRSLGPALPRRARRRERVRRTAPGARRARDLPPTRFVRHAPDRSRPRPEHRARRPLRALDRRRSRASQPTGVPHLQRPQSPRPEAAAPGADPSWRKLARSLSHEIRNPLVSIRTFTELLPEHYADETFRARFKELVGKDVAHIQDVVSRLSKVAERERLIRGARRRLGADRSAARRPARSDRPQSPRRPHRARARRAAGPGRRRCPRDRAHGARSTAPSIRCPSAAICSLRPTGSRAAATAGRVCACCSATTIPRPRGWAASSIRSITSSSTCWPRRSSRPSAVASRSIRPRARRR